MLLRLELTQVQLFALGQIGQRGLDRLTVVIPALFVNGGKAGELDGGMAGAEGVTGRLDLDGHAVVHGSGHLAGQKTAPDQLIQAVLLAGQILLDGFGGQIDVGGTDSLVGVLRARLGLEHPGLFGIIIGAVAAVDELLGSFQRFVGQTQGVGTHIGDQTDGAFALDVYAFVKLLRHRHGAPGGHVQLTGCLLLQGRGDERRGGVAAFILPLDGGHREGASVHRLHHGIDFLLAVQLHLLFLAVELGRKATQIGRNAVQSHIKRPVLLRLKVADLVFPVAHHTGGNRLNASGRQTTADLAPQQRRKLIAHNAIQQTAGLLGIYQVHVNGAGCGNRLADHALGDFVEGDAAGFFVGQLQQFLQMPGNGFAFPVRVGCEKDFFAVLGRLF